MAIGNINTTTELMRNGTYTMEQEFKRMNKSSGSKALNEASLEEIVDYLIVKTSSFPVPSPYHRKMTKRALMNGLFMDSYDIDAMWPLSGNLSPLQHARKKALAPGSRGEGHKTIEKDLKEIHWSTSEALKTYVGTE